MVGKSAITEKISAYNKKEGFKMDKKNTKEKPKGTYCPKESGCCWNFYKKKHKDLV